VVYLRTGFNKKPRKRGRLDAPGKADGVLKPQGYFTSTWGGEKEKPVPLKKAFVRNLGAGVERGGGPEKGVGR